MWITKIAWLVALTASLSHAGQFPIYWNIPVHLCAKHNVTFDLDKFGFIHNQNNSFHGDKVNIWYKPGKFPYLDGETKVNGGIPMEGNITSHLETFLETLRANYEDGYAGISVLDFEQYQPIYNGFVPLPYRELSKAWVRSRFPDLPPKQLENFTKITFEEVAIPYFQVLLEEHKKAYPKSLTGYYHYPYCSNAQLPPPYTQCHHQRIETNDALQKAVFEASTALFPSIYIFKRFGEHYDTYVETVLQETKRVNKKNLPVLPYFWFRYHDDHETFLPKEVALNLLMKAKTDADGLVLWGWTQNLNNEASCTQFKEYLETFLGPALWCLSKMDVTSAQYMVHTAGQLQQDKEQAIFKLFNRHCSVL